MRALGFTTELITRLVEAGFATPTTGHVTDSNNFALDVKCIKINDLKGTALAEC